MGPTVHADSSSAPALSPASAGRPLELLEARRCRDSLKVLLGKEQSAMADFLVALAAFDARHGWEVLGHASLFAFLEAELGLSKGATYLRFTAARLLRRFPSVIEPLRDGRLCLSSIGDLSRVATTQNFAEVLPRFFGRSSREAKEVAAALAPRAEPPVKDLVTRLASSRPLALELPTSSTQAVTHVPGPGRVQAHSVHAHELNAPVRVPERRDEVEPLSADLRRLHVTVSAQVLKKIDAARDGLAHARPNATTEQVLDAALDLLLEKQARSRGQVKRPRAALAPSAAAQSPDPARERPAVLELSEPPPNRHRRAGRRAAIPAAVRRAVWARDGGRCCWPLDGGGTCGSTHRLELDHVVPWAQGGDDSVGNLRLTCARHNALAARAVFGATMTRRYAAPA